MSGTMRPPSGGGPSEAGVARAMTAMTRLGDISPEPPSAAGELPLRCPTCETRYPGDFKVCPTDATELVGAAGEQIVDELIGQLMRDTYKVVRVIGEGGMGRVYEARHVRIRNKRYALKTLHPEFARHDEVLQRFAREAEAAATIKSPHVMQVFDVDETPDGRPFMVGEFLEGRELAEYLSEVGRMRLQAAVRITRQLCSGLMAAHDLGIVHRDMKPENVFLTGDLSAPIAKVIDFGISKAESGSSANLTKTGMIMGTPSFMAPEQARGDKVGPAVDIYATGAILYTMITGRRPFDKPDATATLTAVLLEEPMRPREVDPSIPDGLEAIVQRAMAKKPEDRYATLRDLDRELAPYDEPAAASSLTVHAMQAPHGAGRAPMSSGDLEASQARPLLALLITLGVGLVLGSVLTLVAAVVRLARGADAKANLTGTEAAVTIALIVVSLIAPSVLAFQQLKKTVWGNTAKVLEAVRKLRSPVLVGLAAYGTGSLLVRVIETVFLRRAIGAAWPVWDLLMVFVGLGAAGIAFVQNRR